MTSIAEIPSLPDNTVIPVLQGTLHTIRPVETKTSKPDEDGKTRQFQAQSFLLESPSGRIWCSTLHKEQFLGPELTGVLVKIVSTQGDKGLRGITKISYPGKDNNGNQVTRTSLRLDHGAIISKLEVPPPAKPQPPANPLRTLCREWRVVFDAFREVAPADFTAEDLRSTANTIYIEAQKRNMKIPLGGDDPAKIAPVDGQPNAETMENKPPAAPSLTKEQLGAKVIGGLKITPSMLKGHDLEKVFDLCYADAKHDVPAEFLDAAFDAAKKRHKDEAKLYPAILGNWTKFIGEARKLQAANADAATEMDIAPIFE